MFKKYWKEIFYYCRKKLNDEDMAKDIAEESFIKMWKDYGKFKNEENAKAFVYICARNACFNLFDRAKRFKYVEVEIISQLPVEPLYDFDIIESDVMAFLLEKIEGLPLECGKAFKLLLAGIDSTTAAKKLGITRKTVLNQKLKAIKILKEQLKLKFGI